MISRFLTLLLALILLSCNQSTEKERRLLKLRSLIPYFEVEGISMDAGRIDSLKPHSLFRAKLSRRFLGTKDSLGNNLLNDFKGYYFEISADTARNWKVTYPFKKMSKFVTTRNDTAYIEIPTDTLYRYGYDSLLWNAGFYIISTENTNEWHYLGGKWILLK
ncbi:MAG TPA: hypothetical protein VD884_12420 [Ohtaekwangia sp.]|nr:hypothetical protein [Ohtaekwangia sp.]